MYPLHLNYATTQTHKQLLTLPSGQTGVSCPALRPYLFSPVRIPDVTVGHNSLLVVLVTMQGTKIVNSLT